MVRWRRKIKVKMRVNSVNGGRKDEGGRESQKKKKKKKRERQGKCRAKIWPPHLNSASCLVNSNFFFLFLFFFLLFFSTSKKNHIMKREGSYHFQKKKKMRGRKKKFLEQIKDKRFKVKIFSNPKSQIFNSKFSFLISKISSFNFQISKFQNL